MSGLDAAAAAMLRKLAERADLTDGQFMDQALRMAAKWRSQKIANTVVARDGTKVQHGLFAGMQYLDNVAEGALSARLVGSYESELAPHLAAFANAGLDHVVDIGCAEGYYAVGLARALPHVQVYAFDTSEQARALCLQLATANGVADRVHIGGEFVGADFEQFVDKRALFIVDIEGAEADLLDPSRYPALARLSFIVETHPGARPGVTAELVDRFAPTHDIQLVRQGPKTTPAPEWLASLGHLDSLLAVWEWRATPTPWLVMRPKQG
jgi:hypothetical protein